MIRPLYDWTMRLGASRHAVWALAFVAFIESSVFPIPPDVLLIPMILAARERAWQLAAVCTIASVVGGFAGYAIGAGLYATVGEPILAFYGYAEAFGRFTLRYNEWGAWIVAFFGVTPFPYKVITIASGAFGMEIVPFMVASILARGGRFFIVSALLWRFGEPIRIFIEKYLGLLTIAFCILLVGGFVVLKYVL